MRMPKRGFHNHNAAEDAQVVNVKALARFKKGAEVDAAALAEAGLIRSAAKPVKLLGDGALENAIKVKVNQASASARAKVEAAGGSVELVQA
jgi:large subunit ribosomal protein L15